MITYKIHLIRHGATENNLKMLMVGGRTDIPLVSEGMDELRVLSETYVYPQAQKLYVSPMIRAAQTAEILYPDVWSESVEGLRECDLGDFEGKSLLELRNDEGYLQWVEGRTAPPGGESAAQLGERIVGAFEHILGDMMQNKVTSAAVVTHGLVIMGLMTLCGFPKREMREWATGNGCGYTVSTSASMWMRDHCFELIDTVPAGSPESDGFFKDEPEDTWDDEDQEEDICGDDECAGECR